MLGTDHNCQEIPTKKHRTKDPEKHANCLPVRNISASDLMLVSRQTRRKEVTNYRQESISVKCHISDSTAVNTGDREKSEKRMFVSSCGEKQRTFIEIWVLKTNYFGRRVGVIKDKKKPLL